MTGDASALLKQRPSRKWLDEIEESFLGGGDLRPEQPLLVSPLLTAVEQAQGYKRGGRGFALRALGMLRYLAELAADPHLAPTHGRVGPGTAGNRPIQQRILAQIQSNLPRVRALFAQQGGQGAQSAALAALAARAGEHLVSGEELRATLRRCVDPYESLEFAIVLCSVAMDEDWQAWLREYVSEAVRDASAAASRVQIALVAWCLLCSIGDPVAMETGDAIGRLSASVNIDPYLLWGLFDQPVALEAQKDYIRHCTTPSFALTVAVSLLCGAFDPYLVAMQWTYKRDSLTCVFSGRPQPVARESLTDGQRAVLEVLSSAPSAFALSTNVWKVWGRPDAAGKLRAWLDEQP